MRRGDSLIYCLVGTPKGRYLPRSNLCDRDPAVLWQLFMLRA